MKCEGSLQPVEKRDVFAFETGQVLEVLVAHGDLVEPNTTLVKIDNPDLNVQFRDVEGELNQAESQMLAVKTSLLTNRRGMTREEKSGLSAQLQQLDRQVDSLTKQHDLLANKLAGMTIRSPISGKVITWDVEGLLLRRPVQVGQVLLTVANTAPDAEWELELDMPERRVGHVLAAQAKNEKLAVEYILASVPDRENKATVVEIQGRADVVQRDAGPSIRIRVKIDKNDLADLELRPGMSVTAKVLCGREPLGYVWLHEVWEWVERKVLF